MKIIFSRHAKRQMKWRKITENDVQTVVNNPDTLEDAAKGRKNAFKTIKGKHLKVTYIKENELLTVITAMVKGE